MLLVVCSRAQISVVAFSNGYVSCLAMMFAGDALRDGPASANSNSRTSGGGSGSQHDTDAKQLLPDVALSSSSSSNAVDSAARDATGSGSRSHSDSHNNSAPDDFAGTLMVLCNILLIVS